MRRMTRREKIEREREREKIWFKEGLGVRERYKNGEWERPK